MNAQSTGRDGLSHARTTLFGALLNARDRRGRGAVALEDPQRQPLTYGNLVMGALALGRKLAAATRPREPVGVLLPTMQGSAVVLFALNAFGRTPAMLNYTAGPKALRTACERAGITTIVAARRFIEQGKLDDVVEALEDGRRILWTEDLRASVTSLDKVRAALDGLFARRVVRRSGGGPDDPGVILFTSGSEGTPKAVALSNANLVANARQIARHAGEALSDADTAFNPLPIFHAFGLTAGLLTGLLGGFRVVLYPSPLHYRQVPKLIAATGATILFSTDTFLQGYARAADPADLTGVRYVIAGAERVRDETRRLWEGFGTTILEGYGATECAPVLACNLPQDNRPGTVGRFLPAVEHRLEPVPGIVEGGRLLVRGPNVMLGYLGEDGRPEPLPEGWHDTGDIVAVDEAGFVTIRGRAKRFAKIGGEMVSLAAVEAMSHRLWPDGSHVVVALPDKRKGEQIVLVTDKADADREALQVFARAEGVPELWLPRVVLVAPIPVMGSGKIDYVATAEMARSLRPIL